MEAAIDTSRKWTARAAVWLLVSASAFAAEPAGKSADFFEMRVRPVLAKNCFACHTGSKMGGLELNSREKVLTGGISGPALVPGKPEESLLLKVITHTHERLKMPPSGKLGEQEIQDLQEWIRQGAVWPESATAAAPARAPHGITPEQRAFWSLQPVKNHPAPKVRDAKWPRRQIDNFILAKLEEKGLKPVAPADKVTLLRRVSFDLIGLPPTPEEVDAFLADRSPQAFEKVVDRLLASPHYGERWGRHWLDVARYSEAVNNPPKETVKPNGYRYRDWVIQAFNEDMPYDLFVKAQIAGDLADPAQKDKLIAGLGFYALTPTQIDDRVDATTRGFLGLTVACAQCHDHKYDPIPQKDYYSLLGVFKNTVPEKYPLAPPDIVDAYTKAAKKVQAQEATIKSFLDVQGSQLSDIFATRIGAYLMAARKLGGQAAKDVKPAALSQNLDAETLERWSKYLNKREKEHPFLASWYAARSEEEARRAAEAFQDLVTGIRAEKKAIDEKNRITLGSLAQGQTRKDVSTLSLERNRHVLWSDLFSEKDGVLHYGPGRVEAFLLGDWKAHLDGLKTRLAELKKAAPPEYPFVQTIRDTEKPADIRVYIRGNAQNLGDVAPRRFLAALYDGQPKPFVKGSGRLELAEAIASSDNPLTARVMVNRVWHHHFNRGIVGTPSNFGQMGERPTHPELLDHLTARFMENGWSLKWLHREILLSSTYALGAQHSARNAEVDPDNRLLWRANKRRLEAEAIRDSLLLVANKLDRTMGGPSFMQIEGSDRRTVYAFVSRKKLDTTLALFDFPDATASAEQRIVTNVPLQRLYFMNSEFVWKQAAAFAERLQAEAPSDSERIARAYKLLFGRDVTKQERRLAEDFLTRNKGEWRLLAHALLASTEFIFVN